MIHRVVPAVERDFLEIGRKGFCRLRCLLGRAPQGDEAGIKSGHVDLQHFRGVAFRIDRDYQRRDLVGRQSHRPYRGVFLTEIGRELARVSRERHQIVKSFLCSIGVSVETARIDAEGIEYHLSPETLEAFKTFALKRSA